jgi:hypothetical protein
VRLGVQFSAKQKKLGKKLTLDGSNNRLGIAGMNTKLRSIAIL